MSKIKSEYWLAFLFLILISFKLFLFANKDSSSRPYIIEPLYKRCEAIKKESIGNNVNIKYSKKAKTRINSRKVWMMKWQDTTIPIPKIVYKKLIIFTYQKSVSNLVKHRGFALIANNGTAVTAMHYFKTIKYVHTNGVEFIQQFEKLKKLDPIVSDLQYPEASLFAQKKMFSYRASDLNCQKMGKMRKTYIMSLLMVKDSYSLGEILKVTKKVNSYSGWLSLEKYRFLDYKDLGHFYVWKAYYSRLLKPKLVSNIRIYTKSLLDSNSLGLLIGKKNKKAFRNRPLWLIQLERALKKNRSKDWQTLKKSLEKTGIQIVNTSGG